MSVPFITGGRKKRKRIVIPENLEVAKENSNKHPYECWCCALRFPDEGLRLDHVRKEHDPDHLAYSEFGPK